uniref:Mercuric resistance operon regulatory protein n=2 Tax=Pseudomonas aeruginosa TaxID=287 RepID=A0A5P9WAW4_PSEAI|nr:Mercuric resistance operon regulatory protein [Pseudomonas aeruginosa]QHU24322.1 Mercuric resistance operon regulatory protein MerR [Pseudomonas aeruginosa]
MQRLDSFEKRPFYETVSAIARKGHQHPKISAINLSHESKFVNSQSLTSKTNSNSAYVGFQFHCSPTPDVARVKFVKSAQRLGFSLEEVAGLLRLDDGAHCDEARVLAEQKLGDVRGKLADLRRIESVLVQLVHDCCASHGTVSCPLIVSLHG